MGQSVNLRIQGSPEAHRIEHLPQVREGCSAGHEAALQEVGGREGRILRGVSVGPVWHARHRGWELVYRQCDMQKDCCGIRAQYYCRWGFISFSTARVWGRGSLIGFHTVSPRFHHSFTSVSPTVSPTVSPGISCHFVGKCRKYKKNTIWEGFLSFLFARRKC